MLGQSEHVIEFHLVNGDVERMAIHSTEPDSVFAAVIAHNVEFIDTGDNIRIRRDHVVSARLVEATA